jgi:hypothetical protein
MRTLKKVLHYKDFRILWTVFFTSLEISVISCIKGPHSAIISMPLINSGIVKKYGRNEINSYVNLCVFIRRKLGIRDTCLTYSILLCHMLRWAGVEAKINFGAKKREEKINPEDLNLIGHAWVTVDDEELHLPYKKILQYP